MNLPISWVAAAGPASQLIKQTANLAARSASSIFGDLLQAAPAQPHNGPLEQTSTATSSQKSKNESLSWTDRLESIRSQLSKLVEQSRLKFGLPMTAASAEGFSLVADSHSVSRVMGPEPIRTDLENSLADNPVLTQEIRSVARDKPWSNPAESLNHQYTPRLPDSLRIWIGNPIQ
jgi:hypothetical protein